MNVQAPERKTPDFEFLERASRETSFVYEDPWRIFQIQSDLIQCVETMARALEGAKKVSLCLEVLGEWNPTNNISRRASHADY